MSVIQAGYPIRRQGGCGSQYTGDDTWDDWWQCCPGGTSKPKPYGDNTQCPDGDTGEGAVPAQCANSTWDLWWEKGYFCCEPELMGFTNGLGWYGCATKTLIQSNDTWARATPTGVCSNSPTPSLSSARSASEKGAIAGAAVGGFFGALLIVGMIWFLQRLRSGKSSKPEDYNPSMQAPSYSGPASDTKSVGKVPGELMDHHPMYNELPADIGSSQELPGNSAPNARR